MNVCDTMKQLNSERTDAFMHELYGNGAAENKARYEAVPVSYTNLDVYKRQVQDREALERAIHAVDESGIFSKENA